MDIEELIVTLSKLLGNPCSHCGSGRWTFTIRVFHNKNTTQFDTSNEDTVLITYAYSGCATDEGFDRESDEISFASWKHLKKIIRNMVKEWNIYHFNDSLLTDFIKELKARLRLSIDRSCNIDDDNCTSGIDSDGDAYCYYNDDSADDSDCSSEL